jgi:hypothetical protein
MVFSGNLKEGRSYRTRDGKVWRVVDFSSFEGISCAQLKLVGGKEVLHWRPVSDFLLDVEKQVD